MGRLLLVEDNAVLAGVLCRLLAQRGHDVLVAGDGGRALDILHDEGATLDVILTDVAVPQLGGGALLEVIDALAPQASVMVMSGHGRHMLERLGIDLDRVAVLRKPFDVDWLVRLLDERDRPVP